MKGGRLSAPVDSAIGSSRRPTTCPTSRRTARISGTGSASWTGPTNGVRPRSITAEDELAYHATVLSRVLRGRLESIRLAGGRRRIRRHRDPPRGLLRGTGGGDAAGPGAALDPRGPGPCPVQVRARTWPPQYLPELPPRRRVVGAVLLRAGVGQRPGRRCAAAPSTTAPAASSLNGQKIWTSQGPTATRFLVLVRTGTPESRHRGLSTLMVDADAPGVTVRPITLASGRRELAEVFFDDVRVPRERLIGDVDGGWAVVDAPDAIRARHVRLRRAEQGADRAEPAAGGDGRSTARSTRNARTLRPALRGVVAAQARDRNHGAATGRGSHGRRRTAASTNCCSASAEKEVNDLISRDPTGMDDRRTGRRRRQGTRRRAREVVVLAGRDHHGRHRRGPTRHHRRPPPRVAQGEAMSNAVTTDPVDESWPMVEEAVFRLFDELAAKADSDEHVSIGPRLAELGWADIEAEYPVEACELLFRAQGRSLRTDRLPGPASCWPSWPGCSTSPADGIVLPGLADGYIPGSDDERVVAASCSGRCRAAALVVPVSGPMGSVSIGVVDASKVSTASGMDTFDPSAFWTQVSGPLTVALVDASTEWNRAIGRGASRAGHRTGRAGRAGAAHRRRTRQRACAVRRPDRIVPVAASRAGRCVGGAGRRAGAARRVVALRWPAVGRDRQGRRRAGAPRGQRCGAAGVRRDRPDRRARPAPLCHAWLSDRLRFAGRTISSKRLLGRAAVRHATPRAARCPPSSRGPT